MEFWRASCPLLIPFCYSLANLHVFAHLTNDTNGNLQLSKRHRRQGKNLREMGKAFKLTSIECFHSRGQHLCKFVVTKESVCIRKEFNSHRTGWDTNMAAVSLFWDTSMAAVTSCENTLLSLFY